MHVIRCEPVLADRFRERVLAVGARHEAVFPLAGRGVAARAEQIRDAGLRHMQHRQHRSITRRRAHRDMALAHAKPLHPHVPDRHALLVIVKVEAVKVDALLALDLNDAQHLATYSGMALPLIG